MTRLRYLWRNFTRKHDIDPWETWILLACALSFSFLLLLK